MMGMMHYLPIAKALIFSAASPTPPILDWQGWHSSLELVRTVPLALPLETKEWFGVFDA